MSGDDSGATNWQVALDDMQIGAAYSADAHAQEHLTLPWYGRRHLANPKRALRYFLRGR